MRIEHGHRLVFGPFSLDPLEKRLWRGKREIALQSRPLAVLHYLMTHRGRVISKEELLRQVWAGTHVTKNALQVCVRAIREVLHEELDAPRYFETVGREGYRWIGGAGDATPAMRSAESASGEPQSAVVGRETELAQLDGWLERALEGQRQVVFIAGEPGIGKTTVVDVFLERLRAEGTARIGRGQCIEHYGEGEAYLPVLEALAQVCRAAGGQEAVDILGRYAPTWLCHMPALIDESTLSVLQQRAGGVTHERMLRELVDALDALTAERALVLVIEDLHVSDRSTVELLAYLAERREPARLFIAATYRPATAVVKAHPLRKAVQDLTVHGRCHELRLELLTESDVANYLVARLVAPDNGVAQPSLHAVAPHVHRHTEGNPLFVVNIVAYLLRQNSLREVHGRWELARRLEDLRIPDSLQQMIEQLIAQIDPRDQVMLQAASVQGQGFDAAVVAEALAMEAADVEERLRRLERGHDLVRFVAEDEFPDRTLRLRYRFVHVLYQNVLYNSLQPTRRAELAGAVARALEAYYGDKSDTAALELAHLFNTAREHARAAEYYERAARRAMQIFAPKEAAALASRGVEALERLPDSPERQRCELVLQLALGTALTAAQGFLYREGGAAYTRAYELSRQVGDGRQQFLALRGLLYTHNARAEFHAAREIGERMLKLAEGLRDPPTLVSTHGQVALQLIHLGELVAAREHLERALALYDPRWREEITRLDGFDSGINCLCNEAQVLWRLGYPDQSLERIHEALLSAQREPALAWNLVFTLEFAAAIQVDRRDARAAEKFAQQEIAFASERGFTRFVVTGAILRGSALVEQGRVDEGISKLRRALADYRALGIEQVLPYYLALWAGACVQAGKVAQGLSALNEGLAIIERTAERSCEAELHRLKGRLITLRSQSQRAKAKVGGRGLSTSDADADAEACFRQAIDVARRQSAKSFELRAARDLSRLWRRQGKKKEARRLLAEVYGWFTEGFATADLREAKALLDELGS